uniref:Uncharacterized protein n=1 Tax=Anguilla anguilla TaxID=7936 RepID=A0A0E9QFR9_ANGAN
MLTKNYSYNLGVT